MRRYAIALLACLLAGGLLAAPASARVPTSPDQVRLRGSCTAGPGRISLTVSPRAADGSVRVDAVATRLHAGPRWVGEIGAFDEDGAVLAGRGFRRVASDQGWSVSVLLQLGDHVGPTFVDLNAFERGSARSRYCPLTLFRPPPAGLAWCTSRMPHVIGVRRRADGSLVVRYFQAARADSRWQLEIRAEGADETTSVVVDDRANRQGFLSTKVVLTGVNDPSFSVTARRQQGSSCSIGLDPARMSAPLPDRAEMLRAVRDLRQRANSGL